MPRYISRYSILLIPFIVSATFAAIESYSFAGIASLLLKPIRIFITVLGGLGLVFWIFKIYGENSIYLILNCIFASIVLHALIMIAQFVYPEFKDFVYSIITTGEHRSSFGYNFRMGGLSGSTGGSVLSVVQSVGVLLYPFLAKHNGGGRFVYIIGAILCAISVALCGRSGLIIIVMFLPLAIIISGYTAGGILKAFTVLILFGFTTIGILANADIEASFELSTTLARSFSFFIEFNEKGITNDDTINYLSTGLFLPESFRGFFLGDPEALLNTQFEREVHSDIGYVRNIFGFGLPGMLLYLFPLVFTMLNAYKNRNSHLIHYILGLLCLIMLILHGKETVVYVRMFFPIICLLMACSYIHTKTMLPVKRDLC